MTDPPVATVNGGGEDCPERSEAARPWHVIRAKPQADEIAARSLQREGLEIFFPRVQLPARISGPAIGPLFPGYIFVRQDPNGRRRSLVHRLPGISGWVRFGDLVPSVPHELVTELADRVDGALSGRRGG